MSYKIILAVFYEISHNLHYYLFNGPIFEDILKSK